MRFLLISALMLSITTFAQEENSREFYLAKTFFRSHLSTPVSLSLGTIQKGSWKKNPHLALVKNLRFCIFNGNLMYFLPQDIETLNINEKKLSVFEKIYPINIVTINQGLINAVLFNLNFYTPCVSQHTLAWCSILKLCSVLFLIKLLMIRNHVEYAIKVSTLSSLASSVNTVDCSSSHFE